jgi:hypothetical protein
VLAPTVEIVCISAVAQTDEYGDEKLGMVRGPASQTKVTPASNAGEVECRQVTQRMECVAEICLVDLF